MAYTVILEGGSPWGFRLEGGSEFNEPLRIAKVRINSARIAIVKDEARISIFLHLHGENFSECQKPTKAS